MLGVRAALGSRTTALKQNLENQASTKTDDTEDGQHLLRISFVPGTVHVTRVSSFRLRGGEVSIKLH